MGIPSTDLILYRAQRQNGAAPSAQGNADSTTGVLLGPFTRGTYIIKTNLDVYWLRGASTMTPATDVLTDESTPLTSVPLYGGESMQFDVEHGDVLTDYVGCRTASGTALVHVLKVGDGSRQ